MNVLYINDELATSDGSNYHALGILGSLVSILGSDHVKSFPAPVDGSGKQVNQNAFQWHNRHKNILQFIRIIRKFMLSYIRASRLRRQLKASSWKPTHILARAVIFDITAVILARRYKAKLIYEFNTPMYYEHGVVNRLPFVKAIEKWEHFTLSKADAVYAVSLKCRDMLCSHYHIDTEKFVVIPNGFMEDAFHPSDRKQIRETLRLTEQWQDKFIVIFIGSLKSWHGIDFLCEAAKKLQDNPLVHFVVIGDGEKHPEIVDYCHKSSNMTYKGKLKLRDMIDYLYASDLGIMPYPPNDNFYFSPLKMFDFIGAELPFIGTSQGQIRELCLSSLTEHFLIDDFSVEEIVKKIQSISENPAVYDSMKNSVARIRPLVTWEARTSELIARVRKLSGDCMRST